MNGILLLDKEQGMSSNQALQIVKRILKNNNFTIKKIGHSGSLDPLATGMLPIFINEATKFCQFLLNADKTYMTTMMLGVKTNTSDSDGEIIENNIVPSISKYDIENVLSKFIGKILQTPSMFSALKHKGQPLYKLARKGISVTRKSREIVIHQIKLIAHEKNLITLKVDCSKGTYIRNLVEDIGDELGCGAHVTMLRRLKAGPYTEKMLTITELKKISVKSLNNYLLPIESAVHTLPVLELTKEFATNIKYGKVICMPNLSILGTVILKQNGKVLGIGTVDGNKIAPKRLLNQENTIETN